MSSLCNAGYGDMGAIEELEPEQAKASFDTNVFGTLSVVQAALPILRAQGSGHIFTVSSIGGVIAFPTGGTYTASKFVVEAMSEASQPRWRRSGSRSPSSSRVISPPASVRRCNPRRRSQRTTRPSGHSLSFKPEHVGDPAATTAAIFAAVDADQPPLRLVLGSRMIAKFRAVYQARFEQLGQTGSRIERGSGRAAGLRQRCVPYVGDEVHVTINFEGIKQ